jgi:hypothetical protein
MPLGRLCSAIVVVLGMSAPAWAQVSNVERVRASERVVVGGTTFGDVLRIVGAGTVSSGTGTMNPFVLDADGDGLEDSNTTVSTGGAWTFGTSIGGSSVLSITTPTTVGGYVVSSTGGMYARGDIPVTANGVDEVRMGLRPTFDWPMIILEDAGYTQWSMHNDSGTFYLHRRDGVTGDPPDDPAIPFKIDGNITLGPYGKRLLPSTPYGVDIGSQQYKFGSLWVGDLFADTLVTIENIGTIDNRWLIGSGNILDEDLSPSATTMVVRYNNFASGEFVYLQKFARTEFVKTTSTATLTNKVTNGSFESGTTTGWSGTNATLSNSTTKAFHGERSMLVDSSANPSVAEFTTFSFTTGVTYTVCVNARRVDGATIADGAISLIIRDAHTDMIAQQTATDAWVRMCRTAVAGSDGETNVYLSLKGVDYYIDAVQVEETSTQRPYSEYRASYTITRNEDGGVANQWYAGDGLFSTGASAGYGWLDCYALRGIKSATEQGPACVANVRTGTTFNAWAPRVAWGNLNGIYGYATTTYGFAAGDSSAAWLAFDSTNGIRGMSGGTKKFGITMAGVASFLEGAVTIDNLGIRITNTASTSDESKGFTFIGNETYTKRPGMFYHEVSGNSELVLSNDSKNSGTGSIVLSADTVSISTATSLVIDGATTLTTTVVVPCGTLTFTRGALTNKGAC